MAKTLTYGKEEIATAIASETGYSAFVVRTIVDMVPIKIISALEQGIRVQINGFGTFEPKNRAPRTGRNPHTGQAVPIPARVVPVFKPSPIMREKVGKGAK